MASIVCCDSSGNTITHFTQWDINQKLIVRGADVTSAPSFHFCNKFSKTALILSSVIDNGSIVVDVPNILLQQPTALIVHMYYEASDGSAKTKHTIRIPVLPRTRPDDYSYSEKYGTLQRLEGVFEVDVDGTAAVNFSFRPDVVVIYGEPYTANGVKIDCNLHAVFSEDTETTVKRVSTYSPIGDRDGYPIMNANVVQTETGFSVQRLWHSSHSGEEHVYSGQIYNYVALKYT